MHPALLIILLILFVLLIFGVIILARSGWGGDGDGEAARRTFVMGIAGLTASALVFSLVSLYVAQRGGGLADGSDAPEQITVSQKVAQLEARVAALEAQAARSGQPGGTTVPREETTFRIAPALKEAILRAAPGGEALQRVPGGSGVEVVFCSTDREAGQYWCEIRTASGDAGWVPRPLIDPQPVQGGRPGSTR